MEIIALVFDITLLLLIWATVTILDEMTSKKEPTKKMKINLESKHSM